MTCHEVRGSFPSLIAGKLAITETAPLEAHLEQCPECRKMVDDLYHAAPRDPGGRVVFSGDMGARGRRLLMPVLVVGALAATAILVAPIVVTPALSSFARQEAAALVAAVRDAVHSVRIAVSATNSRIETPVEPRLAGAPNVAASAVPSEAPALAPATPAVPADERMPSSSRAPTATDSTAALPEAEPKRAPRAAPEPAPQPAPSPKTSKPVTASPKAEQAKASQVELPARETPKPETPPTISPVKASESDVVVQLAVRDRGNAERDVNMLLSRVGGTNLGQAEGAAIVAVVPQSSYSEFTRGLAQIGSWNLEASRTSLPDPVRVAVRLAK